MMKRSLTGLAMVLTLLAGIWSVSAASPNFSGTWTLDKSKSQGRQLDNIESYTMVVTQDDKQLTLENKIVAGARAGGDQGGASGQGGGRRQGGLGRQGGQGGQGGGRGGRGGFGMGMGTATYKLDGSETKIESASGRGAATLSAKWKDSGKSLELSNTRTMNFQGNEVTRTTKERWELADDGKTLKVKRSVEGPQGSQESTLIFVKQ